MKHRSWLILVAIIISMLVACDKPEENQAPTVSFTAPVNNSSFILGETLTISVEVNDPEEDMKEVRFYADNIGLGSDQDWPYSFDWETTTIDTGEYTIKAEAIDNDGAKGEAEITIIIYLLEAPSNLSATSVSDSEILLTWADNTEYEAGFKIERDAGSGFVQVAEVDANVTEYTDTGLTFGQSYDYRVAAYTSINTSDYSATVSAFAIAPMVDYDGNLYETIQIGEQVWMSENLKVTHYRNGTAITNVTDAGYWEALTTEAYCIYNNNASGEVDTYGALYNWYAVNDSRNIAPEGWHVPTDEEWKQLEMFLGMSQAEADQWGWRGADEGGWLKETGYEHWLSPNVGANNFSGFTALPGGYRSSENGGFFDKGFNANFWTSTEINSMMLVSDEQGYNYRTISDLKTIATVVLLRSSPFYVYKKVDKIEAAVGDTIHYCINYGTQEGITFNDSVFVYDYLPPGLDIVEGTVVTGENTIYEGIDHTTNRMKFSQSEIHSMDSLAIDFDALITFEAGIEWIENIALVASVIDSSWSNRNPQSRAKTYVLPPLSDLAHKLSYSYSGVYRNSNNWGNGFSVRCVKD